MSVELLFSKKNSPQFILRVNNHNKFNLFGIVKLNFGGFFKDLPHKPVRWEALGVTNKKKV